VTGESLINRSLSFLGSPNQRCIIGFTCAGTESTNVNKSDGPKYQQLLYNILDDVHEEVRPFIIHSYHQLITIALYHLLLDQLTIRFLLYNLTEAHVPSHVRLI